MAQGGEEIVAPPCNTTEVPDSVKCTECNG
jgi:hypothetical protein